MTQWLEQMISRSRQNARLRNVLAMYAVSQIALQCPRFLSTYAVEPQRRTFLGDHRVGSMRPLRSGPHYGELVNAPATN
jgi:hypothetical protein